jgi:parallel beta-helix repeat protein
VDNIISSPCQRSAATTLTPVASPRWTQQHAANSADPGSLVLVAEGTYAPFQVTTVGTADAPVVFRGGPGVMIDATGNAYGIDLFGASYITVEGFHVQAATNVGIRSLGEAQNIIISKNTCSQCQIGGIMVDFTDGAVVESNAVNGTENAYGILLINGCDDAVLRDNFCNSNGGLGISCWALNNNGDDTMTGAEISGNTVFANNTTLPGYGLWIEGLSDSRIANNLLFYNGGGWRCPVRSSA